VELEAVALDHDAQGTMSEIDATHPRSRVPDRHLRLERVGGPSVEQLEAFPGDE
jgi:hypothetical protein